MHRKPGRQGAHPGPAIAGWMAAASRGARVPPRVRPRAAADFEFVTGQRMMAARSPNARAGPRIRPSAAVAPHPPETDPVRARGPRGHRLLGGAHRHLRRAVERRFPRGRAPVRAAVHRAVAEPGARGLRDRLVAPGHRAGDRRGARRAGAALRGARPHLLARGRLHGSGAGRRRAHRLPRDTRQRAVLAADHLLGRLDRPRGCHGAAGRDGRLAPRAAGARAHSAPATHGRLRWRRRHRRGLQRADLGRTVRSRDRARLDRHGELRPADRGLGVLQRHDPPVPRLRSRRTTFRTCSSCPTGSWSSTWCSGWCSGTWRRRFWPCSILPSRASRGCGCRRTGSSASAD